MVELTPFETLYDAAHGPEVPLPRELADIYGELRIPLPADRPYVLGNFVTSLDGVVALNTPGVLTGGGEIAGPDPHDHLLMGLLRSISDAVVVGAGTLAATPRHLWTPEHIYPPYAGVYARLRTELGKLSPPLNVVVTASGALDPQHAVFTSGKVQSLIVTTANGRRQLQTRGLPHNVQAVVVAGTTTISARDVIAAIRSTTAARIILTEGGPRLMGAFFAGNGLDELFLTLAPQIVGRDDLAYRPGLVDGQRFAPEHPLWGALVGVKRSGDHLFLRYGFDKS